MLFLRMLALSGLMVGATLVMTPAAHADEAGDVFENCVTHVNRQRERTATANGKTAERTINRIRQLLREGKEREARQAASQGVQRINRQSAAGVKNIQNTCKRCIRVLRQMGANELAERLAAICRENVQKVNQSKSRAIAAIRGAFG